MAAVSDVERFERFCAAIGLAIEDFQRTIVEEAFSDRRELLVSMPRGSGKTTLVAALVLFELLRDAAAAIVVAAASREQAQILFDEASKLARRDPYIARRVAATRRELRTTTGGVLKVISADADRQLGLIPSAVVVDELGSHPDDELYVALRTALIKGTRKMLVLSTAAVHGEGPLWQLRERCLAQPEVHRDGVLTVARGEHIALIEWALPQEWALDRAKAANPASWISAEALEEQREAVHESAFRRFHCNQWVTAALEPWLPRGAWEACETGALPADGVDRVLAFDGSFNGDSTALVACSMGDRPHLQLVRLWEHTGDSDWRVPILEVEDAIRDVCRRWRVREIAADPYRWARSLELLAAERLPVVEFPQSPMRMIPATTRLYEAVTNGNVTHDGSRDLARHIGNAVLKVSDKGGQLVKPSKTSPRRIDAAVACVMAFERASSQPPRRIPLAAFR